MIDTEKLKDVTHVVTHANCADGVASALILKEALPDARVSFMKYGTKELDELPAEPGMLFCDFSPPKQYTQAFVEAGAIVLDHHTKELVEPFGELGVFGENEHGESGAVLAYKEVWVPIVKEGAFDGKKLRGPNADYGVKIFSILAGIRDTWQTKSALWKAACEQAEALLFYPFGTMPLEEFFTGESAISLGILLFEKKLEAARSSIKQAHRFTINRAPSNRGLNVVVFQGVSTTSDVAEILDKEVDLVVGFRYFQDGDKLKLQFSTRSHTGFDCQAFAQAHGGDGHKPAAGFALSRGLQQNPYEIIKALLSNFPWENAS